MNTDKLDHTAEHIQASVGVIHNKGYIAEIFSSIVDVITEFHKHVGRILEAATHKIPLVNLLVSSIGSVSALLTLRRQKTAAQKRSLGVKVITGLITGAVTVAAFAIPHVAVPLVVIGSASCLTQAIYNIAKSKQELNQLATELKQTQTQNAQLRVSALRQHIKTQKQSLFNKCFKTIISTIALVGTIIMLANPITVIPISIVLAVLVTAHTIYHFHQPDTVNFNQNTIQKITTAAPAAAATQHAVDSFLNSEQHILSASPTAHTTYQAQHQHTVEDITTQHPLPEPKPAPNKKVEVEDEEDEDGGGSSSNAVCAPRITL